MGFLCELESLAGMFECLPGVLVSGLVIFLAMMRRGNAVRVRCEIVELRGSLMHVFWHMLFVSPGFWNWDIYRNIAS